MLDLNKLRTITEWDRVTGINVMDPDGFDRRDPHLYERAFTLEEYMKGAQRSTIAGGAALSLVTALLRRQVDSGGK